MRKQSFDVGVDTTDITNSPTYRRKKPMHCQICAEQGVHTRLNAYNHTGSCLRHPLPKAERHKPFELVGVVYKKGRRLKPITEE